MVTIGWKIWQSGGRQRKGRRCSLSRSRPCRVLPRTAALLLASRFWAAHCVAAARRASSAAPCKGSLSKRAATMEREWQEESLEAGEVALAAEGRAAESPSMVSPASEAQTVEVHAPQGPLGLVFQRESTVLSRMKQCINQIVVSATHWLICAQVLRTRRRCSTRCRSAGPSLASTGGT